MSVPPALDRASVVVLGDGPVGHAVVCRLRHRGIPVRHTGKAQWREVVTTPTDLLITALTFDHEVLEVLNVLGGSGQHRHVLDLTTHSSASAVHCQRHTRPPTSYTAGGVCGGATAIADGAAVLCLGPAPLPPVVESVARILGTVHPFLDASTAATVKLLHNGFLLGQHALLAVILAEARARGIDLNTVEEVLSTGTAGRKLADCSLVRTRRHGRPSTYTSALAHKDAGLITSEFGDLAGKVADTSHRIAAQRCADPSQPFTTPYLTYVQEAQ